LGTPLACDRTTKLGPCLACHCILHFAFFILHFSISCVQHVDRVMPVCDRGVRLAQARARRKPPRAGRY
jgi:hypothetical protein